MGNVLVAQPLSAEEEAWLNDDSDAISRTVNEGQLEFLSSKPDTTILHSVSDLTIDQNSIEDGWVGLKQCYHHLDAVPLMQVEFQYRHMEDLQLVSHTNIGKAWVVEQSIQMEDIAKQASLCIKARVRIFYQNPDGSFSLMNGPFHRRFLDGFYPYHVTLNVHYPKQLLIFVGTTPATQTGYNVSDVNGHITIEAFFEGILKTETRFRLIL